MFELGTMMAAGALADAREAEASATGVLATPAALIRQGWALLSAGQNSQRGHPAAWESALQR